jgi:hypothetical protein
MYVSAATQSAVAGSNFTVDIEIGNAANVGAYEFQLAYDDALVDFVSVTNAGFLGSTGRTIFCPPALLAPGSVRFGCASSGPQAGASGGGALAVVTLRAVAPGTSALNMPLAQLSDPEGDSLPVSASGGSVDITPFALALDVDADGIPNESDVCPTEPDPLQRNDDPETRPNGANVPNDDGTWVNHDESGSACDADDDNDGLTDAEESSGSQCDGQRTNLAALDSDGDRLTDWWECVNGSDPNDPSSKFMGGGAFDTDGDRVPDLWEQRGYNAATSNADTDGDGCHDRIEIASIDGNRAVTDADRLAVARRVFNVWSPEPIQDTVLDIDKNGAVGDPDRLFVARAVLLPDWQPKACP